MSDNKKIPNVPNLRFPEFDGEWEECTFSDIGAFSKGAGISKEQLTKDGTPCILYGELYTKYKNEVIKEIKSRTSIDTNGLVFSKANDVIIPSSGETAIDISTACCVMLDGVLLGGDLNIIRPNKHNGSFLSYQLNGKRKHDIAKIAQGSSIIHLYNESLKKVKITVPTDIKEEDKIVSLLSLLDDRIATQSQIIKELETLMKGLSNKLFSQELRFIDDRGSDFPDFRAVKLRKVMSIPEKIRPTIIDKNKLLTVKLHTKGVSKNDNTETLSLGATNYFSRKKGQFIYGKQNLFNGAFGLVPVKFDGFLSSGDVPALDIDDKKLNGVFFVYYFSRESFYKKLESLASGSGSKRIHETALLGIEIQLPTLDEQNKIANFFSVIDEKIKAERQILKGYTDQKKYLLANMFI